MPTKVAGATTAKKVASTTSTTTPKGEKVLVIAPALQRHIKAIRENRDLEKIAKSAVSVARETLLTALGEITQNTIGTDAKGKRLVSIKLIPSSEKIEWETLAENDPELYQNVRKMLADYITPKGQGKPQIRVDVI